jgi:uncharacterized protein (DUF2141 family)
MKTKYLLLLCLFAAKAFTAKAQSTMELTVTVKGFKSTQGQVLFQMVDENEKEIFTHVGQLTGKTFTLKIDVFKKGKYAINVSHDKNSNKKLDTNVLGIPKEDWGCSNDARGKLGAPKFKDKLFEVNQNKSITMNLVHY